jgi:hypothetical protein
MLSLGFNAGVRSGTPRRIKYLKNSNISTYFIPGITDPGLSHHIYPYENE